MTVNLAKIQSYLEKALETEGIEVYDDSHLHHTHRSYQSEKAYLRIHIPKQDISRLTLHRNVMKWVMAICEQPIHALQIVTK